MSENLSVVQPLTRKASRSNEEVEMEAVRLTLEIHARDVFEKAKKDSEVKR